MGDMADWQIDQMMDTDDSMQPEPDYVFVTGKVVNITTKAVLLDYKGQEEWFPFSQMNIDMSSVPISEWGKGTEVRLAITRWIAAKKNI